MTVALSPTVTLPLASATRAPTASAPTMTTSTPTRPPTDDDDTLRRPGIVRSPFDPACGAGGMLSVAEEYLRELNPEAKLEVFGQELNPESYAICRSDMIIKGQNPETGARPARRAHRGVQFDEPAGRGGGKHGVLRPVGSTVP